MPLTRIGREADRIARRISKREPMRPANLHNPMSPPVFGGGRGAYPTVQQTQANVLGVPGEGPALPSPKVGTLDGDTTVLPPRALSPTGRRIARKTSDAATD